MSANQAYYFMPSDNPFNYRIYISDDLRYSESFRRGRAYPDTYPVTKPILDIVCKGQRWMISVRGKSYDTVLLYSTTYSKSVF